MKVKCSICQHPKSAEIVAHYLITDSLRETARCYAVGYRSLQRHISACLLHLCREQNEIEFETELILQSAILKRDLNERFIAARLDKRKPRPKPMVTKPIRHTWSRKGWKTQKPKKT